MKLRAKILLGSVLVLVIVLLCNCRIIAYGIKQGIGQLRIAHGAVPIDELLEDPEYPDSLKTKLLLIKDIRRFAIDSLGMKDSKNYNSVYDLKGKPAAYVVQACEKYRIKKYLWKFPIVGKLPYKGFFSEKDAQKEARKLEDEGYDVRIANPSGWSTMGWFNDPVLSSMLRRREGGLSELIIHELTHSTIFVKDDSELNENIADYVGEYGTRYYLSSKYGDSSEYVLRYNAFIADGEILANHFIRGARYLDSLYTSEAFVNMPDAEKDQLKSQAINRIISEVDSLPLRVMDPEMMKQRRLKDVNNTFFTGYITYHNRKADLIKECNEKFGGDFMKHFADLKSKYGK